jgi:hypothetical protein
MKTSEILGLMAGVKTQIRLPFTNYFGDKPRGITLTRNVTGNGVWYVDEFGSSTKERFAVGDLLTVRETWSVKPGGEDNGFVYKADDPFSEYPNGSSKDGDKDRYGAPAKWTRWSPSTNMPEIATRFFLKITESNVQRLREMFLMDAYEEGFPTGNSLDQFSLAWDTRYYLSKPWAMWDKNPFVWVFKFQVLTLKPLVPATAMFLGVKK